MSVYIEPMNTLILDGEALEGRRVNNELFGGFCECGGVMLQKAVFQSGKKNVILSECERCWKNRAMILENGEVDVKDVRVVNRGKMSEFLKEILSDSELEAIRNKAKGREYSYTSFSKAKKKLEKLGLDVGEVMKLL